MYDELVKRLREVEEMLKVAQFKEAENLIGQAADAVEELTDRNVGKWIPVAERIPEKAGKYLVCGRWRGKQAEIWVCEFTTLGCLKGWANNAANPSVSHWMPLPEPPKEE